MRQFEAQVAAPAVTLAQSRARDARVTEHNLNVLLGEGPTAIPRRRSLTAAVAALVDPRLDSAGAARAPPGRAASGAQRTRRRRAHRRRRRGATADGQHRRIDWARRPAYPNNLFGRQTRTSTRCWSGFRFPLFDNGRLASQSAAARGARGAGDGVVRVDGAQRGSRSERRARRRAHGTRRSRRAGDASARAAAGARSRRVAIRGGVVDRTSICSMRSGACSAPSWR